MARCKGRLMRMLGWLGWVGGVLASPPGPAPLAAQAVFAGTVVDDRAAPIEGARVIVRGTMQEATTDGAGRFRLPGVGAGPITLEVTRIGFRKWTGTVAANQAVTVTLERVAIDLSELVVTGTAVPVERRAVGNSVDRIEASAVAEVTPVKSVADLLRGRSSSVTVVGVAGVVGAGPQLAIRGRGSLSLTGEPLIYIDGVRANNAVATGPTVNASEPSISRLGDLNPNDIESIEVIKGPAAATLYGTEASNGVIQIITKRGRANARPTVETVVRGGANWFMNPEGRIPHNFLLQGGTIVEQDLLAQERAAGRPLFRTGSAQGYDLSVRGGSGIVQYFAGAGFSREEGIEVRNVFTRMSGRANLTITPDETVDIGLNFGVTNARRDLSLDRGLSLFFALSFGNPATRDGPTRGFNTAPPEFWSTAWETFQDVDRYVTGVTVNHRPFAWLRQRLTFGLDQDAEDNQAISELQPDALRQFFTSAVDRNGRKIVNRRNESVTTLDYAVSATANLGKVTSTTSLGAQYYRRFSKTQYSEGQGFPAPGIATVSAAATTFGGDDYLENVTLGTYVQQVFGFNDRLFLTGAIRADDNSAFGADFDLVTYPKASLAWVVSEEPFWNIDFLETVKLRAAYGQSGMQPSAFAALRTYRATTGATGSAVSPSALGNPDLGPERSSEIEVGVEAGLFGGRVGVELGYYRKDTRDMILTRLPAPSSGFSSAQFFNAGHVRNQGLEALVRISPIETAAVKWDVEFNVATNSSRIIDLDPNNPGLTSITTAGVYRHVEGEPVGVAYERRIVSAMFNPATGQAENLLCDPGPAGGAPVSCATAPAVALGGVLPTWEGGFSSSLRLWDRVTLFSHFDFRGGHLLRDETNWARCAIFRICEINVRPENFDPVELGYTQLGLRGRYFSKADFLKLRELSLTIDIPDRWARGLGADRASLSLAGRNLHTWTGYTGMDPENAASTAIQQFNFYEQTTTPQLATFLATLRVTW